MQGPKGQAPARSLEDAATELVGPDGLTPGSTATYGRADAFGETSNPQAYVPRESMDLALAKLEACAGQGVIGSVVAQPGLGKTMLLRLLSQRLTPKLECVFLPYAALDLQGLCAWTIGLLGEAPSEEPEHGLRVLAGALAREGRALVLLVDDAGSMPLDTARGLSRLIGESHGNLRLVLAAADDSASRRVLVAVDPEMVEVRLADGLTLTETQQYLHERLRLAKAPPVVRARFDAVTVDRIHRLSAGIPRRIHELATTVLTEIPTGFGADDDWLGGPLDELAVDPAEFELLYTDDLEPLTRTAEARAAKEGDDLGFFRRLLSQD